MSSRSLNPLRASRSQLPSVATFAALAFVVLVVLARRDAGAMQLSAAQKTEMKQHYDRATRAYDIQKYTEAVDEYQKAYEIGGDPAMLYNVAQSYRLNDQLPDAVRFYRRYLQRSPNARNRDDVERKIAELEKTLEDRRKAAAALAVASPPVAPVVASQAPVAPPPAAPPPADGSAGARRVTGIVFASLGAAGLVTFAITGILAKNKGDDLTSQSKNSEMYDPALQDDGKRFDKIAIVSAIAGGAALVTGAVLILSSLSAETPERTTSFLTPVVGPGLMGAAATGRF